MSKAHCYDRKLSVATKAHCLWIRANKRHLCSPPLNCLERNLKSTGCYVYNKTPVLARKCAWIKKHPQGPCPKGCFQKKLSKAGCYDIYKSKSKRCGWMRKNKQALCPVGCLQIKLANHKCYGGWRTKLNGHNLRKCTWIR